MMKSSTIKLVCKDCKAAGAKQCFCLCNQCRRPYPDSYRASYMSHSILMVVCRECANSSSNPEKSKRHVAL